MDSGFLSVTPVRGILFHITANFHK